MKKGLTSLSDDLEETVKGINDFIKSLRKALKDLKEVTIEPDVQTVSTSSKRVASPKTATAKTAAASTLFNLLSGSPGVTPGVPATAAAGPAASVGLPKPPIAGTPARPASSGPPKAPSSGGPPKRSNLPPAPKLPPSSGVAPPAAPSGGVTKSPSFAKRPGPPAAPTSGPPKAPGISPPAAPGSPTAPLGGVAAAVANKPGGGLSSLRDEMLEELNRLKKIMRGE